MTIHTTVGLFLGFLGICILTAAWWQEARRNDRNELALAEQRADITAITEWLGINIAEEPAVEPDLPPTEPSDLPLQVQAALLAAKPRPTPAPTIERTFGDHTFNFKAQEEAR